MASQASEISSRATDRWRLIRPVILILRTWRKLGLAIDEARTKCDADQFGSRTRTKFSLDAAAAVCRSLLIDTNDTGDRR